MSTSTQLPAIIEDSTSQAPAVYDPNDPSNDPVITRSTPASTTDGVYTPARPYFTSLDIILDYPPVPRRVTRSKTGLRLPLTPTRFITTSGLPCSLLVTSDGTIEPPSNVATRLSRLTFRKPSDDALGLHHLSSAVYQLRIEILPQRVPSLIGAMFPIPEAERSTGTALHIGNGYFLTTAHNLLRPIGTVRRPFTIRIVVKSAAGRIIDFCDGIPVDIIAAPEGYTMDGPLLDWDGPKQGLHHVDLALLRARNVQRIPNSYLLPAPASCQRYEAPPDHSFFDGSGDFDLDCRFLGVNSVLDAKVRDRLVRSHPDNIKTIGKWVHKCLPDTISTATGKLCISHHDEWSLARVSLLQGASGSACLAMDGRLIGLFIGSTHDEERNAVAPEEDSAIVLPFTMSGVRDFISRHVLPCFRDNAEISAAWKAAVTIPSASI